MITIVKQTSQFQEPEQFVSTPCGDWLYKETEVFVPHEINIDFLDHEIVKYRYYPTYELEDLQIHHNAKLGRGPDGVPGSQNKHKFPNTDYSVALIDPHSNIPSEKWVMVAPPPVRKAQRDNNFIISISDYVTNHELSVAAKQVEPARPRDIRLGRSAIQPNMGTVKRDVPLSLMDRLSRKARRDELRIIKYKAYEKDINNARLIQFMRKLQKSYLSTTAPPPVAIQHHTECFVVKSLLKVSKRNFQKFCIATCINEYDTNLLHYLKIHPDDKSNSRLRAKIKECQRAPVVQWELHELHILSHYWKAAQEELYLHNLLCAYEDMLPKNGRNKVNIYIQKHNIMLGQTAGNVLLGDLPVYKTICQGYMGDKLPVMYADYTMYRCLIQSGS